MRKHLQAVALFVVVLLLVFHRAIFFGETLASVDLLSKELPWRSVLPADAPVKNFTAADVFTVFYPWKHFVHDELQAGRFPLWCKYVGCGYPLAGAGTIKLFGLTTLCLWWASPPVASWMTFAVQLFVAMAGMYVLLRSFELRWGSAVFGGLVFGLNSAMFQHLEFEHMTGALMMLPWMCWALWRAASPSYPRRYVALSGLCFGLAIINGSLQSAAIVWFSAAGFAVAVQWRQSRLRTMANLAGLTALGLLVGAIALAPNLELFALNTRERFAGLDWWELTWKRPVALLPWLASSINPDSIGNYRTFDLLRALGRMGTGATTPTMSDIRVYCGLAAVALAVLGLRSQHPARRLGLWLLLVPLGVATLTPFYLILYFRVLIAGAYGLAVLAALGWERFCRPDEFWRRDSRRVALALAVLVGIAAAVGTLVTARQSSLLGKVEQAGLKGTSFYRAEKDWQRQKAAQTVINFSWRGAAVARFILVAGLVALLLRHGGGRPVAATLLVLLNTADVIEFAQRTFPSAPARFDYPSTPALKFLRAQPGMFRVCSAWDLETQSPTARPNLLMTAGLDDPRVYESLSPTNPILARQDWDELNVRYFVCPPDSVSPVTEGRRVYHGEVDIFENPHAQPRVYFATELNGPATAAARIEEYVSGGIRLTVTAPQAGWLVVRERSYPGWRVQVNGKPAVADRAQEFWLAVPVAAGDSEVQWRFQPATVRWGATTSGLALIGIGMLWMWDRKRPVR